MHRLSFIEEKILHIQGSPVRVQKKMIKSLRLRLIPPHGEIRLSVPHWYSDRKAEQFVLSRWDWIKEQQKNIHSIHPLARQNYEEGEQILFRGRLYTLRISETEKRRTIKLREDEIHISEKAGIEAAERRSHIESWYRKEMKKLIDPVILSWAAEMKVEPSEWRIKKMNSRWGSCNTRVGRIWLNLELITMRPEIMEYVIVHELAHLLEASHNKRFKTILDSYLPEWRRLSRELKGEMAL
ncbi:MULTISPECIES: M48 family metallopeptidase [unclassified Oceanispirochaeta]|uniref:M48 family metallopeptidase n=1 Tax=unclassified Oceanispirochaeta TaxID=2635722 RepID=UPI000E098943|nr:MULTISPECIES: SprT family zinc-dependent metalloprotease [unclassified Oceanispirochaeta]MBF9014524.1 M48 family metallopeptidase [Oceanispirochaeta sp. M2]NPD70780.1 M48 family metallopeptidase [Oceanispirochaeta sp. M1]RDG34061.1 M48 family peptidase [Oceanispirochaeta sp. M1]